MSLRSRLSASPILVYTLLGGLFGFTFPIVALFINALQMRLPLNLQIVGQVHSHSILQWLIDTAPLVLAAFAYLAGRRQQQVLELNRRLTHFIDDRDQLIVQLQKTAVEREEEIQRSLTQLSTAAQIAKQSTSLSADAPAAAVSGMLTQALHHSAGLISAQFGFYHVGIFITDAAYMPTAHTFSAAASSTATDSQGQRYATLVASNSEGGQRMLKRGHRLKIGGAGIGTGIVGYVAAEGKPKIALDVGAEAEYFDNPDLPETRSEMTLPLIIAEKTVGVLDVQSTASAAFAERDVAVMSLIAEGLSSTIENAHLIQQLRSSLENVRKLHQQYLQRAWSETLSLEENLEYTTGRPAAASGTADASAGNQHKLRVPIILRDQLIGEIRLEGGPRSPVGVVEQQNAAEQRSEWLPEEISLAESIADQAAQALENARLLRETQRRAERERITANIAGKVWSFSDIDTILQTALQELGESLNANDGFIQLRAVDMPSGAYADGMVTKTAANDEEKNASRE